MISSIILFISAFFVAVGVALMLAGTIWDEAGAKTAGIHVMLIAVFAGYFVAQIFNFLNLCGVPPITCTICDKNTNEYKHVKLCIDCYNKYKYVDPNEVKKDAKSN